MDKTYAYRLHKYELALRGFFLVSLRLQIKPYKDFFIYNGYLPDPASLIKPDALQSAYINSYRYISDADMYGEWKRQDIDLKKSQKDFSVDDGFLIISETLKSFFIQAGLTNFNNIKNDLTQTTIDAINDFVSKARAGGASDAEIYAAMSGVFEDKLKERAGLIAATEAHTISMLVKRKTAMEFFNQKGVTGYHTWFTRLDERVRHTHVEVEGRTIPVDVKYVLNKKRGGIEFAQYPGDPALTAENRVHCRCTEEYHSDPDKFRAK